ncbi:MAG: HipA N-terminal domain-containing protein [Deltaproteobacteria bacterium]|nr:HipA N-terminal domain-containing protein [Deltaproteobacteria bacterium]
MSRSIPLRLETYDSFLDRSIVYFLDNLRPEGLAPNYLRKRKGIEKTNYYDYFTIYGLDCPGVSRFVTPTPFTNGLKGDYKVFAEITIN